MPFKKGHPPMGGRKSMAQELSDYEALRAKWTTPGLGDEIIKRIGTGKESLEDIFFALGFKEEVKVLVEVFKKLYPDNLDVTSGVKPLQIIFDESFKTSSETKGDNSQ